MACLAITTNMMTIVMASSAFMVHFSHDWEQMSPMAFSTVRKHKSADYIVSSWTQAKSCGNFYLNVTEKL